VPRATQFWRAPYQPYGGTFFGSGSNPDAALDPAVRAALRFAQALTRYQNTLMRQGGGPARIQKLQQTIIREPTRYELQYSPARAPVKASANFAPALWRAGLVGAMVGLLLLCVGRLMPAPRSAPAALGGPAPPLAWRSREAFAIAAALALAALLTALASTSVTAYTVIFVGLIIAFAFAFCRVEGRAAVRALVASVIVISALRGALLGVANAISLPDGLTLVNAIQPAIVAGCAAAVLLERRARFPRSARPLLVGWALIAGVAVLDLATQSVGLHVYAIGLAQYLTYPTLAVIAWLALERGDSERIVRLFILVGAVVAISVFLEAAGLVNWVEAAAPNGDIVTGNRYGGATGSYLHASIFLGTAAVLAMALVLERWRQRPGLFAGGVLALIVGAMALTLSRGGFAIAGIGAVALLVGASGRDRRRLVGAGAVVLSLAVVLGAAGGVTPGKLGSRLGSGFSASGDPGNVDRFKSMRQAVNHYKGLPATQKAFGEGLAATGNARLIASLQPIPTESYPLKLLLETGLFGALIIGGYLVWAATRFAKTSIRGPTRLVRAAGAAGLGFTVYGLVYPTLEVQLLAMTWWMLLVACLAVARLPRDEEEPE
jgi:hypothetical protein